VLKPLKEATKCLKARSKHRSFRAIYKVILVFEYVIRAYKVILRTYNHVSFNAYPKALEDYLAINLNTT
jgi:tryptophan 2,3-dioxygenase